MYKRKQVCGRLEYFLYNIIAHSEKQDENFIDKIVENITQR